MNKKGWLYLSVGAILASVVTLVLPVISYLDPSGVYQAYNVFGLLGLSNVEPLSTFVFADYEGTFLKGVSFEAITAMAAALCLLGVLAIVAALTGIFSMSKQYESEKPYRRARFGLVGTAIPALTLLVLYLFSFSQFPGVMWLGPYVFVTPVAMLLALRAVTARHRLSKEEAEARKIASAYIRPAGDLPIVKRRGNQYYG